MKRFFFLCILTFLTFSSSFSQENNDLQKLERHYFDEYSNISINNELARLDPFLISFNEYPKAKALIVLYFDKNTNSRDNAYRIKIFFDYIKRRKFESSRILFAINNETDEKRTVLWQMFPDDNVFEFISKNSTLIKGEEFEEKLKEALLNRKL